jgi:hypothetical protein
VNFAIKPLNNGNRHMRGAFVSCGHCGVVKTVKVNTFTGTPSDQDEIEQQFIVKKLQEMGWLVGKKSEQHRCPGCYSAIKASQARKNEEKVVTLPVKIAEPDAPRTMSRDDRRIVFEKLNEVYVDEKVGYGPGWTDSKVATDLGVPRAWVKQVRDEMFGPEGSNEEIRATINEAQTLLNDIRVVSNAIAEASGPLKALLDKAEQIDKRVRQIQQELR